MLWLVLLSLPPTADHQEAILAEIHKAAACKTVDECTVIAENHCPFGCAVAVNKKHAKELKARIDEYGTTCALSCPDPKSHVLRCERGLCVRGPDRTTTPEQRAEETRRLNLLERTFALQGRVPVEVAYLHTRLGLIVQRLRARQTLEADVEAISELELQFPPRTEPVNKTQIKKTTKSAENKPAK